MAYTFILLFIFVTMQQHPDTKAALIQFLESFGVLQQEEIALVAERTQLQHYKKGTVLLSEGEVAKECYSVIQGCVREYYLVDGVEKTTAFFTEGQPISSFTSFSNATASKHYLACVEDCLLTVSNASLEQEMCQLIPHLESIIRQEVEKNAGALQDRMASFMTSTPEQRFLALMEENPQLIGRAPQHQIASYLGVTPESLSRIKKRVYSS